MRIGLNLLGALPEATGGWTYIRNLLAAIARHDADNRYFAFVHPHSTCLIPDQSNFERVTIGIQARHRSVRILCENTRLPWLARRLRLDCLHWFGNVQGMINSVPAVVTVHDLIPFHPFAPFLWSKRLYLQCMLRTTVCRAPILLPVSQATARELHARLTVPLERMLVVPAIIEDGFVPPVPESVQQFRATHGLPDEFWLYVAHGYPHKNHRSLLRALRRLRDEGGAPWLLALRGDELERDAEICSARKQHARESELTILPPIGRGEMPLLYAAASALVFPSQYEGGGLPVMEALACGCPAAVADIPATREFAGDAAAFFDPLDVASIADTLRRLQANPALRAELRTRGLQRAGRFRDNGAVLRLLEIYGRVAAGRRPGISRRGGPAAPLGCDF